MPGRIKANLKESIGALGELARLEVERQEMMPVTSILWRSMCDGAHDTLSQLLVENSNKQMDWGLRRHRHRVNPPRLAVMYWWFLLYHFVLFKNRGVSGISVEEELPELQIASQKFIEYVAARPDFGFVVPEPWEKRWNNQVSLEATLGIYNRSMHLLGLPIDLDSRVFNVSLFTSATEHAYDSTIKPELSNRFQTT